MLQGLIDTLPCRQFFVASGKGMAGVLRCLLLPWMQPAGAETDSQS
jgi:hypothetical protein